MSTRLIPIAFAAAAVTAGLIGIAPPGVAAVAGPTEAASVGDPVHPALDSSFIQAKAAATWSDADWTRHFDDLEESSISQVVLNVSIDTATVATNDDVEPLTAYYPTTLPGYSRAVDAAGKPVDVVGRVLDSSRSRGMAVWVGLQLDAPDWYGNDDHSVMQKQNDPTWLAAQADLAGRVARDIVDVEGSSALEGWFFPGEETPWGQDSGDVHNAFYRQLSSALDTSTPGMRIMISPYYNATAGKTSSQFQAYLTQMLRGTSIDVVALQTSAFGAPGGDRSDQTARSAMIAEWATATRRGVDAAGIGAQTWANIELFDFDAGGPGAVDDAVAAMKAAAPFVDGFTSWSITNTWSYSYAVDWWLEPYQAYVATGAIPSQPVSEPTVVSSNATTTTETVRWTAPTGQKIAYAELLAVTPGGTKRYAGWNNGADVATVTAPADPAATWWLRTRSAAGDRSSLVRVG